MKDVFRTQKYDVRAFYKNSLLSCVTWHLILIILPSTILLLRTIKDFTAVCDSFNLFKIKLHKMLHVKTQIIYPVIKLFCYNVSCINMYIVFDAYCGATQGLIGPAHS